MQGVFYRTVEDYMEWNNIGIVNKIPFDKNSLNKINEEHVKKQLYIISKFHSSMKNCDEYILQRIGNETGKLVEGLKMDLNKVQKVVDSINREGAKNNFEKLLMSDGRGIIELGERCVQNIYSNGYINTIVRSMDEGEICIGDSYFDNLMERDGKIHVKNTKKISYNTVEMDGFYLLSKLKRKKVDMNWEELIAYFCGFEKLNFNSEEIIRWLINYPYDFVKCCIRYRNGKKKWDDKKYEGKLRTAIIDAENII